MICRWGRRLIYTSHPLQHLKIQSLSSSHNLSSTTVHTHQQKYNIDNLNTQKPSQPSRTRTILTPQLTHKTLLRCPSDLLALTFFLWCAKQPHYFHDSLAFDHIVVVVSRLTERFGSIKGIIEELKQLGCVIKPQTLLLLLRIYWRGGMFVRVFEVFEEMIHYGYTPNTFARNIVIDVLFKLELVEVALNVLKETEVPNFLSFSITITNLCKVNALVEIGGVHRRMMREGYYLNGGTYYLMVLSCFCKSGKVAEAFQLLGLVVTLGFGVSVTHWSVLIDMFCKCGRLDVAYSLLEKMVESGYSLNVVTCTSLIKGFFESNNSRKAFELLYMMESKGCYPDLVLCNLMIRCLVKMGRCDDALDIFYSLKERGLTPDVYTFCAMVQAVCYARQYVLLPVILDGFVVKPDLVACNVLMSYYWKSGNPGFAIEFYEDMIDRGYTPDRYSFTTLIGSLCEAGRIDDAVNVYNGIVRSHFSLDARFHTVIVSGLIKSRKFSRAITLFKKAVVQKSPLDIVSYAIVIGGLFRSGEVEEALSLFNQMKEARLVPSLEIYNLIVSHFCKCKNVKMVKQVLQEMFVMGINVDCSIIYSMSNLLYKSRDPYSVLNLFIELRDSGLLHVKECDLINKLMNGVDLDDVVSGGQLNFDGITDAALAAC